MELSLRDYMSSHASRTSRSASRTSRHASTSQHSSSPSLHPLPPPPSPAHVLVSPLPSKRIIQPRVSSIKSSHHDQTSSHHDNGYESDSTIETQSPSFEIPLSCPPRMDYVAFQDWLQDHMRELIPSSIGDFMEKELGIHSFNALSKFLETYDGNYYSSILGMENYDILRRYLVDYKIILAFLARYLPNENSSSTYTEFLTFRSTVHARYDGLLLPSEELGQTK